MANSEVATKLVISYLDAEGIMVGTPEIRKKVEFWEAKLDPIDAVSLASVVLFDPKKIILSLPEIRKIREVFFPSN